ncbi:D,D-heptose 1,7-bisphosphate phosphatase [Brasilonema octagenarum UFV-E1]|uniref:D,D-heptose 1,7-bisphosphate phosphatase n=2 Tax=Brasilonema TaxID=383614 RepID=A0A856MEM6_9CYAN|nr:MULTISPECIES: HAD family hydrolase [Brasilonema]NMF63591.1 D,D-heptose 1,7-bisphosphate phosphatase [Brasilonema octagenarum UFV-OR1]QDL08121.1 D,D-heptose 1,7-bisphosphate phosphatase [Brasilonema sennae CENA114]QDL14481.1 D,D-heptose 1,7-bisphosphate phosphatase [Brasilonema octagenarum UFV-E1]
MQRNSHVRPAVFLDRDGTLIKHVHHLCSPEQVVLEQGAAEALCLLQSAGFACVVVTNQSVVGRGMLTFEGLKAIHDKMEQLLSMQGASVEGIYFSTHVPRTSDLRKVEYFDRKPGPGMLLLAAQELGLSVADSWMIGDSISDVLAGVNAGCKGSCLLKTGLYSLEWQDDNQISFLASDILDAVQIILKQHSICI